MQDAAGAPHLRQVVRKGRPQVGAQLDDLGFTEWQPAVLGSTRRPSDWMNDQKLCPLRPLPPSRRNGTVTTSAPDA